MLSIFISGDRHVQKARISYAESVNAVLEKQNIPERIDHRSYKQQGIEQVPTVHMGVAATQMEKRDIETERGNMNREISRINQVLFSVLAKLKQLKDWLKEAVTPAAHNNKDEKPSIMAQLEKYKKEIKNAEPSALSELCTRRDRALQNVKHFDVSLKRTKDPEEWEKLLIERRKAYDKYSALKTEVKTAKASLPNKKPRSRYWER